MTADPTAVLMLAAVVWLEGVRRLPRQARLLRRRGRRWDLARPLRLAGEFALVSWCAALSPSVVLTGGGAPPGRDASRASRLLRARRWRVRRALATARIAAVLLLAVIVAGIPVAMGRWRVWGLLGALACALALAATISSAAAVALRRLDTGWHDTVRAAAPLLWPFTALRGYEVILAHVAHGFADVVVMRELMGDVALLSAGRAALYDARHDRPPVRDALVSAGELCDAYSPELLEEYLDGPPAGWDADGRYCPRCEAQYVARQPRCAECEGAIATRRGGPAITPGLQTALA